jgi:hypothetical protein
VGLHVPSWRWISFSSVVFLLAQIVAANGFAAELSRPPNAHDRSVEKEFLDKKLALWKQRLGLVDWVVTITFSKQSDLRPGTLGNIHWDPDNKTAEIRVLDSSNAERLSAAELLEFENTIVHELVHLELSALPKTDDSRRDEEAAVNRLAAALLEMDRKDSSASLLKQ